MSLLKYQVTISPIEKLDSSKHHGFKGFLIECRPTWQGSAIGVWKTNVKHTKTLACADSENVNKIL